MEALNSLRNAYPKQTPTQESNHLHTIDPEMRQTILPDG
jgi:hypothetical protein